MHSINVNGGYTFSAGSKFSHEYIKSGRRINFFRFRAISDGANPPLGTREFKPKIDRAPLAAIRSQATERMIGLPNIEKKVVPLLFHLSHKGMSLKLFFFDKDLFLRNCNEHCLPRPFGRVSHSF